MGNNNSTPEDQQPSQPSQPKPQQTQQQQSNPKPQQQSQPSQQKPKQSSKQQHKSKIEEKEQKEEKEIKDSQIIKPVKIIKFEDVLNSSNDNDKKQYIDIGVDLGTTYCSIGYYDLTKRRPILIKFDSKTEIPSWIRFVTNPNDNKEFYIYVGYS